MAGRKIFEGRIAEAGGVMVELWGDEVGGPEIYVEGVHGITATGSTVKLNMFTTSPESTPQLMRRELVCRLAMPIDEFMEFAKFVAEVAKDFRQFAGPPGSAPGIAPAPAPAPLAAPHKSSDDLPPEGELL
ncbi:MAG TPA: hypothetical protein VM325_17030 [Alphaproteobacteria bacterium]|nr:hypothetical protein [Alphaproteobacteria bacterium]